MSVDIRFAINQAGPVNAIDLREDLDPSFFETVGAQLGYSYRPIIDGLNNANNYYNTEYDENYDPRPDMQGYEEYIDTLVHAKNAEHMSVLKNQIDDNISRRETMAAAGFWTNLGAGFVDPVNFIALPFAGPTVGLMRSAGRGALIAGGTQLGLETIRAPFDPLNTVEESALNVGATAVFGSLINGAISIPMTRRANAYNSTVKSHEEFLREVGISEDVQNLSMNDLSNVLPREERGYGSVTSEKIDTVIRAEEKNIYGINERLKTLNEKETLTKEETEQLSSLVKGLDESERTLSAAKKERALRSIEDAGAGADVYDIAPSFFVNSPFFNAVTTPIKRVLNSNIVNSGKAAMLKLGHDSGLQLVGNKLGMSVGPSVYQRAKVMEGEWVQLNRLFTNLWSESIGLKDAKRPLGINVADIVERGSKRVNGVDRTYGSWLQEVNRKRIHGLAGDNDLEDQALRGLNDFYKRWQERLEDVGLLGTRKNLEKKIAEQEYLLEKYRKKLAAYDKRKDDKGIRIREHYEERIVRLTQAVDENRMSYEAMGDQTILPANEDVFSPRYWNMDKIKQDRAGLERIIADWYKENPTIYVKENGKYVQKKLDPSDQAVAQRAKDTVDNILGLKDVMNPDGISYGFGKSKHLRHRELDIPNRLVYDYIVQDPMAVMKAYNHRTAGVYQFNKMFNGKSLGDVLDDLEEEMLLAGNSQKEINAYRRDFVAMHDRIVGTPVRNFDRWDFKTAQVMKDLAYMNYLGSAGFSAIADFSRIIMEHELGDVVKGLTTLIDVPSLKLSRQELDIIGEAIEIIQGSAHIRVTGDMTNNPLQSSYWDTARNVYNVVNLLGPMTQIAKEFDGLIRGHTLVKLSKDWANGTITQKDASYLAQYNITKEIAEEIARAPVQQSASGLYLPNTSAWKNTIQFPDTTAKIITGPTNKFATGEGIGTISIKEKGTYISAYYNKNSNTIYIDEDYIRDVMYPARWWETPRTEGIKGISSDIIRSADDLVQFVKMHEIMHTIHRPENINLKISPPKSGFVRIYRFAVKDKKTGKVPDWLSESSDYQDMIKATGRWFTDDIEEAKWYAKENPEGELLYTDIPLKDLEGYRVSNIKETSDGLRPKDFSARPEKELFVPKEIANKSKPFSHLEKIAYENEINDLTIAEFRNQPRVSEEATETFRTALQSGILNTIMMGTPADRPIITDGVVYVPHKIAKVFGYEEDLIVKGYSRLESGLLGLPFQFYSYSLAAMNKVTAAYTQGQIKNRTIGALAAMGLGYMAVQIKTPDWAWEQMEWSDRFARSFDQSGLLALGSDLLYSSINTSMALGYGNFMDGIIEPKFPQGADAVDAATGILGAGPSIAADLTINPISSFIQGDTGEGMKTFLRNLPFMRVWLWKGWMNEMTNALTD